MKIFGSGFSFPLNKLEIGYELRRVSWQKMCNILRVRSANHTTNCTNFLSTHWIFQFFFNINPFLRKKREKVCFSLRAICGDRKKVAGRLFFFYIFSFLLWLWETKSLSLLLPALRAELKQEKQLFERLSHKALKSYQHDGWDWGTPMAPCIILAWGRFGNRLPISTNTWLSHPPAPPPPLPSPFPASAGPPTWFLVFVPPPSPKILLPFSLGVWPCWPLVERKEKGENTHMHIHTQGCGCVQRARRRRRTKFRVCNHVALFPIRKQLIVDTSRGENCWLRV